MQNQIMSGNNVVSGWFCSALKVVIQFDNAPPIEVPYGGQRNDTITVCGDTNNGYASIIPYGALGEGTHRLRVSVDGVVRTDITFTVVTFGLEFLSGVTGEGSVTLSNGQEALVRWSEAVQGFVVIAVTNHPAPDFSGTWLLSLNQTSNDCTGPPATDDFAASGGIAFGDTVTITHTNPIITLIGNPGFTWTGNVEPNGDFDLFRLEAKREMDTGVGGICLHQRWDVFEGNFFSGVVTYTSSLFSLTNPPAVCNQIGISCSIEHAGQIDLISGS